jgi:hypothetical protein
MKTLLVPALSLAVIGAAALLTTSVSAPRAPECVQIIETPVVESPVVPSYRFAQPPPRAPRPAAPSPTPVA